MLLAAAASVVKSDALAGATKAVEQGVQGIAGALGITDTPLDRERKAHAADLLARALAGDDAAVIALGFEAFEPRQGLPGDPRTPVDGKTSPQAVRDLAVSKLKRYVTERGGLPASASQWAAKLKAAVLDTRLSLVDATLGAVERGVATATKDAAAERVDTAFARARPWLIGAGVVVALGALWYFNRRK